MVTTGSCAATGAGLSSSARGGRPPSVRVNEKRANVIARRIAARPVELFEAEADAVDGLVTTLTAALGVFRELLARRRGRGLVRRDARDPRRRRQRRSAQEVRQHEEPARHRVRVREPAMRREKRRMHERATDRRAA